MELRYFLSFSNGFSFDLVQFLIISNKRGTDVGIGNNLNSLKNYYINYNYYSHSCIFSISFALLGNSLPNSGYL